MNQRCRFCSYTLLKADWKNLVLGCRRKEIRALDERADGGRVFQMVDAAARKER